MASRHVADVTKIDEKQLEPDPVALSYDSAVDSLVSTKLTNSESNHVQISQALRGSAIPVSNTVATAASASHDDNESNVPVLAATGATILPQPTSASLALRVAGAEANATRTENLNSVSQTMPRTARSARNERPNTDSTTETILNSNSLTTKHDTAASFVPAIASRADETNDSGTIASSRSIRRTGRQARRPRGVAAKVSNPQNEPNGVDEAPADARIALASADVNLTTPAASNNPMVSLPSSQSLTPALVDQENKSLAAATTVKTHPTSRRARRPRLVAHAPRDPDPARQPILAIGDTDPPTQQQVEAEQSIQISSATDTALPPLHSVTRDEEELDNTSMSTPTTTSDNRDRRASGVLDANKVDISTTTPLAAQVNTAYSTNQIDEMPVDTRVSITHRVPRLKSPNRSTKAVEAARAGATTGSQAPRNSRASSGSNVTTPESSGSHFATVSSLDKIGAANTMNHDAVGLLASSQLVATDKTMSPSTHKSTSPLAEKSTWPSKGLVPTWRVPEKAKQKSGVGVRLGLGSSTGELHSEERFDIDTSDKLEGGAADCDDDGDLEIFNLAQAIRLLPRQPQSQYLATSALANDVWRGLMPSQPHVDVAATPSNLDTDLPSKQTRWRQVRGLDDDLRTPVAMGKEQKEISRSFLGPGLDLLADTLTVTPTHGSISFLRKGNGHMDQKATSPSDLLALLTPSTASPTTALDEETLGRDAVVKSDVSFDPLNGHKEHGMTDEDVHMHSEARRLVSPETASTVGSAPDASPVPPAGPVTDSTPNTTPPANSLKVAEKHAQVTPEKVAVQRLDALLDTQRMRLNLSNALQGQNERSYSHGHMLRPIVDSVVSESALAMFDTPFGAARRRKATPSSNSSFDASRSPPKSMTATPNETLLSNPGQNTTVNSASIEQPPLTKVEIPEGNSEAADHMEDQIFHMHVSVIATTLM